MAEFLIRAFDTHDPDPERDLFAYKMGHVISVQKDGHVWGSKECLPVFWIVKVPGLAVSDALEYAKALEDLTGYPDEPPAQIGIRKWKFNYNTLPAAAKNMLNSTGIITVTANKILDYIEMVTLG